MKQKNQYVLLGSLLFGAAIIWYFNRNTPTAQNGLLATVQDVRLLSVENPHLRTEEIARAQKTEYKSSGRNIFSPTPPPPPFDPKKVVSKVTTPPVIVDSGPPPIPPLPGKFFGYGTIPNGTAKRAFLLDGEVLSIVKEGDVLQNRFRIIKIGNATLEYEEISSGRRATVNFEEQPTGPAV